MRFYMMMEDTDVFRIIFSVYGCTGDSTVKIESWTWGLFRTG